MTLGTIVKLPRQSRASRAQAERLRQLALDLQLSPEARAELDNALHKITEVPGRTWVFVMISPEQFRFVTKATKTATNPDLTLQIWNAAVAYMRMETGEILASREQLAAEAETRPQHVSTAMSDLTKIGAIIRHRRGRRTVYFVNPHVGWNGGEGARQEAAKTAPALRLVDNGPGE